MKITLLILSLIYAQLSMSQTTDTVFIINPALNDTIVDSISFKNTHNKYGDLLNDDPLYNPRKPWYAVSAKVLSSNLFNWALNRYFFKVDWTSSGIKDWKNNFKKGPVWDEDGFGTNFIGHPHTGSYYFNAARSNGYTYWSSLPFALQGSLTWEFLGENERPSWNDMINTPVSGLFLGEVFYRVSSNILDDQSRGRQRVWRELLAGVINPTRAFNRLTSGKMFCVTGKEVYQKEPMNITLSTGIHKVNNRVGRDNRFGTGSTNAMLNMQLDYGDPFETRHRKPFDLFRFRIELGYGSDKRLLDHINGYGILVGKNIKVKRLLGGIFQHYDYWRNNIFEVATIGFGGGLLSRIAVGNHSNIYSNVHLAVVPLAGNNNPGLPDTSAFRTYNFGGGMQAKLEETFNLNNWATISFNGYFYWLHTYSGLKGNSLVYILKPQVTVKLYKNLRIGFEHHIYHNDRLQQKEAPHLHLTRTEQKLFLQFLFEDPKRKGLYH
jgi:hypothetical protein